MKKKTLAMVMAITVVMGAALTGCGNSDSEERTGTGKESTVTVEEKSEEEKEEPKKESTDVISENKEPEDYTYCNLLSDPYFDMDNAIKDELGTESVQSALKSAADKELLYNVVDGDKYVEISGAESYDVNRTFTVGNNTHLYPNLAYYGIDPNPQCTGVPGNRFFCMNTSWLEGESGAYIIDRNDVTILKAYTIPKDDNNGYSMVTGVGGCDDFRTPALCEVEYNGEHYWTLEISLQEALGQ